MYQKKIYVYDKSFNIHKISQYILLVSISAQRLRISCLCPLEKRCLLLAVYQLTSIKFDDEHQKSLETLFEENYFMAYKGWAKIIICFENQQYTLIPSALFEANNSIHYLDLAVGKVTGTIGYTAHTDISVTVVFSAPQKLVLWLQNHYKLGNFQLIHQASLIIATSIAYAKKNSSLDTLEPLACIHIEIGYVHITIIKQTHLIYYNRFNYDTSEKLLNYILTVMKSLSFDPSHHKALLTGCLTKGSCLYKIISLYIRCVRTLDAASQGIKYGWSFKKSILTEHMDLINFYSATNKLDNLR